MFSKCSGSLGNYNSHFDLPVVPLMHLIYISSVRTKKASLYSKYLIDKEVVSVS